MISQVKTFKENISLRPFQSNIFVAFYMASAFFKLGCFKLERLSQQAAWNKVRNVLANEAISLSLLINTISQL